MVLPLELKHEQAAAEALKALGFTRNGDRWEMSLETPQGPVSLHAALPSEFPRKLPSFFVADRKSLSRPVPHVELLGKICIANEANLLLDVDRPDAIVKDAFERAKATLLDGLEGKNDDDFVTEYGAYWRYGATKLSILSPSKPTRVIVEVTYRPPIADNDIRSLLADSIEAARDWIKNLGGELRNSGSAFLFNLPKPFPVSPDALTIAQFLGHVQELVSDVEWKAFQKWLDTVTLPSSVVFRFSVKSDQSYLAGGVLGKPDKSLGQKFTFKPKSHRASAQLAMVEAKSLNRFRIERMDPEYLLPRGGTTTALRQKKVVVLGCGAVGSAVCDQVASAGVGRLEIVDKETLTSANVHRHLLGVDSNNSSKAGAVAEFLQRKFPHLSILGWQTKAEEYILKVKDADLVFNCTGDETYGLHLNDSHFSSWPIVHAWVDPLDLGGHALLSLPAQPGCFRCIFADDATLGLYNAASFTEPGQDFTRTFSGCAGVFVPFSRMDAALIAVHATRLALKTLSSSESKPTLLSLPGAQEEFEKTEFKKSKRVDLVKPCGLLMEHGFKNPNCPVCSS